MTRREIITAALLTLGILILNLSLPTMLQENEEIWTRSIELHKTLGPFPLRPLVTQTTLFISHTTGLSLKWAFILNQYPLLFLMFLSFAIFLKKLGLNRNDRIIGLILLGTAYPIMCLHFIPNYSWDDIWLYLGLIWMSYFLVDGRILPAAIIMLLSTLAREAILMFAPIFFVWGRPKKSFVKIVAALMIPFICYGIYRYFQFLDVMPDRFRYWAENFANLPAARQSFYSLFVSFGWMWAAFVLSLRAIPRDTAGIASDTYAKLKTSAFIMVPLTVALVLLMVKARETRIFFPPFIYMVPLGVVWLKNALAELVSRRIGIRFYITWAVILAITVLLSIGLFPSFPFLPILDFHRVLFALNLILALFILAYGRRLHAPIEMPNGEIQRRSE